MILPYISAMMLQPSVGWSQDHSSQNRSVYPMKVHLAQDTERRAGSDKVRKPIPPHTEGLSHIKILKADKLRFRETAYISVSTIISPKTRSQLKLGTRSERSYRNRVSDICLKRLKRSNGRNDVVSSSTLIENDGLNIIIQIVLESNSRGIPYRTILREFQGQLRWISIIERPNYKFIGENIPISPSGRMPNGQEYWDPQRDVSALAEYFCQRINNGGINAN